MKTLRTSLAKAAEKAPPGYLEVCMNNRDPSKDTATHIFIPAERRPAITAWKNAGGTGRPPEPTDPVIRPATRTDSESCSGGKLDPKVWGPGKWAELHARPDHMGTPAEEVEFIREWFNSIPCQLCQDHAAQILRRMPPDLSSAAAYSVWGISFHNEINTLLNKPIFSGDPT